MAKQTITTIAIILLLAGAGLLLYQGGGTSAPPDGAETAKLETRLEELRRITQIKFDTSILQDPSFRSLQTSPEIPQSQTEIGRQNPFLPIQ